MEELKIRRCGPGWACCSGDCENCLANKLTCSTHTESTPNPTYSDQSVVD